MAIPVAVVVFSLLSFSFSSGRSTTGNEDYLLDAGLEDKSEGTPRVEEDVNWPGFPHLKQVSAVSVDGDGNLHVFHRGDRTFNAQTFDRYHKLNNIRQGPIPNDTVLVIDTTNGKVLYTWGANKFYMPHGMTVDRFGNTWMTDIGLHQVFKFPAREENAELVLGEAFVPGAGKNHLCQPTDIAVSSSGNFFVSDGYCNSRILMFSSRGRVLKEIGAKDGMNIPHSLTLVPEHDAVCVADRENGRVLCYATGTDGTMPGTPLVSIDGQGIGRVYAIETRGKQLFAVNGPEPWKNSPSVTSGHGLILDIESGLPKSLWGPDKGFLMPHDLSVSPDGKFVYVSEVDVSAPKRVYKFNIWD